MTKSSQTAKEEDIESQHTFTQHIYTYTHKDWTTEERIKRKLWIIIRDYHIGCAFPKTKLSNRNRTKLNDKRLAAQTTGSERRVINASLAVLEHGNYYFHHTNAHTSTPINTVNHQGHPNCYDKHTLWESKGREGRIGKTIGLDTHTHTHNASSATKRVTANLLR